MRKGLINRVKRTVVSVGAGGAVLAAAAVPALADVSTSSDTMPLFNGTVLATAYVGNTIYVGGNFTSVNVRGATVARARLAAMDATTGELLPWAPAANARVKAIAASGTAVYVAGDFSSIDGIKRDSLAQVDAATGAVATAFKHSISGRPYALAAAGERLYLGGSFTSVSGATRTRLAAFDLITGKLDATWKPAADDQVEVLAAAEDRIYVGGKFHRVNKISGYSRLVALHPSTGKIVTTFRPKASVITYGIAVTAKAVYTAHGGSGGKISAYSRSGSLRWSATFDGDAQAVAVLGDTVYAGGHFDNACKTVRTGDQGACLDGSDDRVKLAALAVSDGKLRSWKANANGVEGVLTMATHPSLGALLAGGSFTMINGKPTKRLAQFR